MGSPTLDLTKPREAGQVASPLANEVSEYFVACGGGKDRNYPPLNAVGLKRLIALCKIPELPGNGPDFLEGVALVKGACEADLNDRILVQELGFTTSDGEKVLQHPNALVRLIGQVLLLCAAAHYIG
ncbi:MAG: hypothetical protein V1826_01660 [bacterium]